MNASTKRVVNEQDKKAQDSLTLTVA